MNKIFYKIRILKLDSYESNRQFRLNIQSRGCSQFYCIFISCTFLITEVSETIQKRQMVAERLYLDSTSLTFWAKKTPITESTMEPFQREKLRSPVSSSQLTPDHATLLQQVKQFRY